MREMERQRQEAERQHKLEEARRLDAIYNRLTATMKLNGLPDLHLKGIDQSSSGGLQLKLGDQSQTKSYGISGLPGAYTGGSRDVQSLNGAAAMPDGGLAESDGLKLKLGDSASPPKASDSSSSGYGVPGLPGIQTTCDCYSKIHRDNLLDRNHCFCRCPRPWLTRRTPLYKRRGSANASI
jgi:hypothetical protein